MAIQKLLAAAEVTDPHHAIGREIAGGFDSLCKINSRKRYF